MGFSKYDSKLTLEFLLETNENQFYDRKSASIKIPKLAEAIVGFANADGGLIAVGIDDRKIQGVLSQGNTKVNDLIQCGFEKCFPSVNFKHEKIEVIKDNGKRDEIILIHIEPSIDTVHKTEADEVFLRVGDETKKLSFDQRVDLEYDKGSRLYEDQIIENCALDNLDKEVLENYKDTLDFKGSIEELLLARGFLRNINGELKLTVAGVLMFAKYPTAYVPSAKLRFFRYDGIKAEVGTSMNISKQKLFEAPIPKLIDESKEFIDTQLREFTALDKNVGKFITVPEYPPFAWQEGVINAITHRAYNIHGDDIKVFMFDDRLEIHSPGQLPNIVSVENIKYTRYSRNPKIARALSELGWVRELNEGVKRIYSDMEQFFLDPPIYKETNSSVILTLKNNIIMRRQRREERISSIINRSWKTLTDDEKTALEIAYGKDKLKTKQLAEALGKSPQYARKILKKLEEKKFVKKIASSEKDPNLHYILNSGEESSD
ncbi:putative DNA binding domain-containing protein [Bacillus sp. ISL-41]|uniref:ATP-binding protein n=1 Tax=Bacillus sp. ISL-41 TaxID=2819127 RepID=UPI001BE922D0|nr:ATP-binding protein [Bacillus sp. ISL-41]MBT2641719.1 putative DNA binding domain-containing protein [Bacillus sp. ISL-41]